MAMSEVDSFFFKFKQLLHSGRKAHLEIKSEAGKAVVHLTAEVDVNEDDHHRAQPRNRPARQRRREKRAALRDAAATAAEQSGAGSATEKVTEERVEDIEKDPTVVAKAKVVEETKEVAVKALEVKETEEVANKEENTTSKTTIPVIEVQDEFCPNESYETKSSNTPLSYSAAAAPSRKLAGFDYYSLKYSSESDTEWK